MEKLFIEINIFHNCKDFKNTYRNTHFIQFMSKKLKINLEECKKIRFM